MAKAPDLHRFLPLMPPGPVPPTEIRILPRNFRLGKGKRCVSRNGARRTVEAKGKHESDETDEPAKRGNPDCDGQPRICKAEAFD
jgi:hypothetical protein